MVELAGLGLALRGVMLKRGSGALHGEGAVLGLGGGRGGHRAAFFFFGFASSSAAWAAFFARSSHVIR